MNEKALAHWGLLHQIKKKHPSGNSAHIFNGYWGLFPTGWNSWGVGMSSHLHLMLRLRMRGMLLNILSTIK